jgi:beta-lactamase superfamily II metal-dependent hydrolase
MKRLAVLFSLLVVFSVSAFAKDAAKNLRIFFVDVEGGQATLFVTPQGRSLLIDTGWPGQNGRDADRIVTAAKSAGLNRIDYVLLTHYHDDHTGGVPQLVERIPVGTFIDHGPNREPNDEITEDRYQSYQKVLATGKYKHITAKPGDTIPIKGLKVEVITADGEMIAKPLHGTGEANSFCSASETRAADTSENARSLGVVLTFHHTRILDLGDLTWDKEMQLMCPTNRLGKIDVLVVSHHGFEQSNSPALVDAIQPRVAIMDNGAKKGGSTPTIETIRKIPGLETLWQLHYSVEAGASNTDEKHIANLEGPDTGNNLYLSIAPSGAFTVLNTRTQETATYPAH